MVVDKMVKGIWEYPFFVVVSLSIFLLSDYFFFSFTPFFTESAITTITVVSATLFGFILTGVALLLGLPSNSKISFIRKSPLYANVYRLEFKTMKWLALTTVASFFVLFVPVAISHAIFISLIIFSTTYVAFSVWAMKEMVMLLVIK